MIASLIQEKVHILNIGAPFGFSDELDVNSKLLIYADSCIALLEFVVKVGPFKNSDAERGPLAHKILREWRNVNHHEGYLAFTPRRNYLDDINNVCNFYIAPDLFIGMYKFKEFKESIENVLPDQKGSSRATLSDLLEKHQDYIKKVLGSIDKCIQEDARKVAYCNPYPIAEHGGRRINECSDDEFWAEV